MMTMYTRLTCSIGVIKSLFATKQVKSSSQFIFQRMPMATPKYLKSVRSLQSISLSLKEIESVTKMLQKVKRGKQINRIKVLRMDN